MPHYTDSPLLFFLTISALAVGILAALAIILRVRRRSIQRSDRVSTPRPIIQPPPRRAVGRGQAGGSPGQQLYPGEPASRVATTLAPIRSAIVGGGTVAPAGSG